MIRACGRDTSSCGACAQMWREIACDGGQEGPERGPTCPLQHSHSCEPTPTRGHACQLPTRAWGAAQRARTKAVACGALVGPRGVGLEEHVADEGAHLHTRRAQSRDHRAVARHLPWLVRPVEVHRRRARLADESEELLPGGAVAAGVAQHERRADRAQAVLQRVERVVQPVLGSTTQWPAALLRGRRRHVHGDHGCPALGGRVEGGVVGEPEVAHPHPH
eukprot:6517200-Prymnesium_polylepis.2